MITFVKEYIDIMKLVFATNNKNKLKEVKELLPDSIELLSLNDIDCQDEVAETESTLEGNAKLKADHITNKYELNCFADDTGLEVESLDGRPGVHSARFGGEEKNASKNIEKLLKELEGKENRKAQFRTAICLNIDGKQFTFEGVCKGDISEKKSGYYGFGYDPVFKPKGFQESFAAMKLWEKNRISHRAIAVRKLVEFLTDYK